MAVVMVAGKMLVRLGHGHDLGRGRYLGHGHDLGRGRYLGHGRRELTHLVHVHYPMHVSDLIIFLAVIFIVFVVYFLITLLYNAVVT